MKGKFIIYQLIPRLFGNTNDNCVPNSSIYTNGSGKLADINYDILNYIKDLGVQYVWYTGVLEHATKTDYSNFGIKQNSPSYVKGIAGSPYAIKDYYDIDPDLATHPDRRAVEFNDLVSRTHSCGLGVIIDLVPNHIAREYHSDSRPEGIEDFNDKNLYILKGRLTLPTDSIDYAESPAKASGNDCFLTNPSINDWYDTVKLNYNNKDTWYKIYDIVRFWASKGVDGFRCDMAEMVPVEFWSWLIGNIKIEYPSLLFIAEIYDKSRYHIYLSEGKFDFLYDKSGLYETLIAVSQHKSGADEITKSWQSVDKIQNRLLNFLENHDESRLASDFILGEPERAIPALAVSTLLNRAPFLLYFGQELGERGMDAEGYSGIDGKTTIFDYWSVKSVREMLTDDLKPSIFEEYRKLMRLSTQVKAFSHGETFDLNYANPDSEDYSRFFNYSFVRFYGDDLYLVAVNFKNQPCSLKIMMPLHMFTHFNISGFYCDEYKIDLLPESYISVNINKYSYIILRFTKYN